MFKPLVKLLVALSVAGWASAASAYPITDTVTVEGTDWAQPDLFTNLTWNDINTVCPGGVCGNGTLNGFDMQGWTWATTADLNNLFNHYIGFAALGPGPDRNSGDQNTFADAFFADGWRFTYEIVGTSKSTSGFTADSASLWSQMFALRDAQFICNALPCGGLTNYDAAITDQNQLTPNFPSGNTNPPGAWMIRSSTEIPIPATLPLLGLGLAALGYSRPKRNRFGEKTAKQNNGE